VVGEHHVILAGAGERLVLSHHADDRGALVAGTLAAVRFIAGRAPGSYGMREVFGLRPSGSA
jgi:4-hydroxy-tetrahydrodipicolinate reductase